MPTQLKKPQIKPNPIDIFTNGQDGTQSVTLPEPKKADIDPVGNRRGHIQRKVVPLESMGHIESRRDSRKVRMTAYVDRDVYEQLRAYCVRTGRSAGDLITIWLNHDLHERDYNS